MLSRKMVLWYGLKLATKCVSVSSGASWEEIWWRPMLAAVYAQLGATGRSNKVICSWLSPVLREVGYELRPTTTRARVGATY